MAKKTIIAVIAVFLLWSIVDFLVHGVLLSSAYEATAQLWRPMEEMKMGLLRVVGLISATTFVSIYTLFFSEKSVGTGLKYGLLFGLGAGVSMGYGSYAVMPLPYNMALAWFLTTFVEAALGGLLAGFILRDKS